jgi:hypothetical protein
MMYKKTKRYHLKEVSGEFTNKSYLFFIDLEL